MKTLNKVLYILTAVFGVASLVLFFTNFATITTGDFSKDFVGAQLALGSKVDINGAEYDMAKSADILFCFVLTILSAVLGIFSYKSKKLRYAASGFGIVVAIYMLVIRILGAFKFVDPRPISYDEITSITFSPFVLIAVIALFLFVICSIAYLLVDDYLEVLASNGEKRTILKSVIHFIKDYKSEIKKIVWPNLRDVVKNTVIVLILCLIIGIIIWGVDFGLGKLIDVILGD